MPISESERRAGRGLSGLDIKNRYFPSADYLAGRATGSRSQDEKSPNEKRDHMGHREELIQRSIPFLEEVKDMTPGVQMEKWLNEKYDENSDLYKDLARLIKLGVE